MNCREIKRKIESVYAHFKYSVWLYITILVGFACNQYLYVESIGGMGSHFPMSILKLGTEGIFFLLPFVFIKSKYRWLSVSLIWVQTLWIYISLPYYRFWKDLPSYADLASLGNVNSDLAKMAITLYNIQDAYYLIILILTTVIALRLRKLCTHDFPGKEKVLMTIFSISCLIVSQLGYFYSHKQWNDGLKGTSIIQNIKNHYNTQIFLKKDYVLKTGLSSYLIHNIRGIFSLLCVTPNLSENQEKEVFSFLNAIDKNNSGISEQFTKPQNIILII